LSNSEFWSFVSEKSKRKNPNLPVEKELFSVTGALFNPKRRRRELCHSKNLPLRLAMPRQRHLFASAPLVRLAANMRFLELLNSEFAG
jgi:hypothetical protein